MKLRKGILIVICAALVISTVLIYIISTANLSIEVKVTKDVKYGEGLTHTSWLSDEAESMDLLLDIYEPEEENPLKRAVVFIHGGGFKGGDKSVESGVKIVEYFVKRGFVGFSINYRLLDNYGTIPEAWNTRADEMYANGKLSDQKREQLKAMYPAGRDAKAAIRWIHSNAERFDIDVNYITVMGGSAGAITAIALGVTEEEDYRDELSIGEDPTLETTNLQASAKVHTIIDFWGSGVMVQALSDVLDKEERWDSTDAPVCIVHGTNDKTVTYDQALELESFYRQTGVSHRLYTLQGTGHAAWGATYEGKSLAELAFDFVLEQQPLHVGE